MATYAPRHVDILGWTAWNEASATPFRGNLTTYLGMGYYGVGALNDYVTAKVALDAGTWTVTVIHDKDTNRGIATVSLGGSTLGTIDAYAAATANVVTQFTGVTVATAGVYDLKLLITGKNGSSSNYFFGLNHVAATRTGA